MFDYSKAHKSKTMPPKKQTKTRSGTKRTGSSPTTKGKGTSTPKKKKPATKAEVVQEAMVVAEPKTPTKPKLKSNPYKKYYVVYTLTSGDMESFEDIEASMEFQQEYESLISSSQYFDTKAKMNAFVTAGKDAAEKPDPDVEVISGEAMSPDDKNRFNRIRAMMEQAKPKDTLFIYWKTTPKSKIAVFVLVAKSQWKDRVWFVKKPFGDVLVNYFKATPTDNTFANDFLTNIKTAKERDQEKGNNDTRVEIRKTDGRSFDQYLMWTWCNLPIDKFESEQDEVTYIEENVGATIAHIRSAQRTTLFMHVVQTAYTEAMFNAMQTAKPNSTTFKDFVQKCRIQVEKCPNLNKFLILDESKTIQMFLWKNEVKTRKYPLATKAELKVIKSEPVEVTPCVKETETKQNADEETEVIAKVLDGSESDTDTDNDLD